MKGWEMFFRPWAAGFSGLNEWTYRSRISGMDRFEESTHADGAGFWFWFWFWFCPGRFHSTRVMTPGAHSVFLPAGLQRLPLRPTTIACFEGHWELHPRHTPHFQLHVNIISISVECTSSSTTNPLKAYGRWLPPLLPTVCWANGQTSSPLFALRPNVRPASDRDVKLPRQVDVICFHSQHCHCRGWG